MNKNISILSFDQDWAPDYICNYVAKILIKNKVKSTWFITNESPFLNTLRQYPELFELGIHPNFLPNSSHGNTSEEVIASIKKIVPEAKCSRSHAVYQCGSIIQELRNKFDIEWELSMFQYEIENIFPSKLFTSSTNMLNRLPVFWCDDHEFMNPKKDWSINKYSTFRGIKVFSFHPIHVYLNSGSNKEYNIYKQLAEKTEAAIQSIISKDRGSRTAFLDLVLQLSKQENYFIKELNY